MREILFRGKRVDNGEWETGFLVIERYQTSEERFYITDKMTGYHTPILPKTVGQYTGLTDKNGTKIFEGDIVKYGKGIYEWNKKDWEFEVGIIDFKDGAFIINDIYSNDGYNELSCLYHEINYSGKYDSGTLLEVIGNIHDNFELLAG